MCVFLIQYSMLIPTVACTSGVSNLHLQLWRVRDTFFGSYVDKNTGLNEKKKYTQLWKPFFLFLIPSAKVTCPQPSSAFYLI